MKEMPGLIVRCAVAAGLALALAGCGGGGATELGEVTSADLAIMPLPPPVLGDLLEGLEVDPGESGPQDAAAQADDTSDPDDTAADLEGQGYVDGYDLEWLGDNPDAGIVGIGEGVMEFGTAAEAQAFAKSIFAWDEDHVGEQVGQGVKLLAVEPREVEGVGDLAIAATETASVGGVKVTASLIAFTVGQVVGGVSLYGSKGDELTARTDELAAALADRIVAVADGEIDEEPVPIPAADEGESTASVEPDPSLKPLALSLADLPRGAKVVREEFVDSEGDTSFEREFEFPVGTRVGRSALAGLESDVERLDSAVEASLLVGLIGGMAESPDFAGTLAELSGTELIDPKGVTVRRLDTKGIADETVAVHATFDTGFGKFESVFAYMAVGRVAGQLYAFAPAGRFDTDDVLALARKMAARMRRDG